MDHEVAPSIFWTLPFVAILLSIALFPLIPAVSHWWEHNRSKLMMSVGLGLITCGYYVARGRGVHGSEAGLPAAAAILHHALVEDFFPFIVLLFSLFTISGGVRLTGDIPAHPITNVIILSIGAVLASIIGTTGASMLLIRPLLQINSERHKVTHTVIFFIFLVSNIGGSLLPVGDPPLFLGFLRGVPFLWTLSLGAEWMFCVAILLAVYWALDMYEYKLEARADIIRDETQIEPFRLQGKINLLLLLGVVLAVGLLVPGRDLPGTSWVVPHIYLREWVQLALTGLSLALTSKAVRDANGFNFAAIGEVACLFIGIFVTMQAPIEILNIKGPSLGLTSPVHFFWASGILSSFLDNAPTYVVFFQAAGTLPHAAGTEILSGVATASGTIAVPLLKAIACGSVFMGANSYIGNGPNFMVKAVAEQAGVKMPGFFGYMIWSGCVLIPLFALITLVFFRG